MVIKNYIKGIAFVLIILGIISTAFGTVGITPTPSPNGTIVYNQAGDSNRFFGVDYDNPVNVTWYINTTDITSSSGVNGKQNVLKSNYTNSSAASGTWIVKAIATNTSNSSDTVTAQWTWIVSDTPASSNTTPDFTVNPTHGGITDTSAYINFSVNQSNALAKVRYGTDSSLGLGEAWNNNSASRTIPITGLTKGTLYYYNVSLYNSSNQSLIKNSTIQSFTTIDPTAPNATVTSATPEDITANISFTLNQTDAKTSVHYGTSPSLELIPVWNNGTGSPRTIQLTSLSQGTPYFYSVYAYNGTNQSHASNSTVGTFTTRYPSPTIGTDYSPTPNTTTIDITQGQSQLFWVKASQNVTVNWYLNDSLISGATKTVDPNIEANYTFVGNTVGNFKITANASNANGSSTKEWLINVRSKSFFTGNRIWDGSRPSEFSLTYSWNPMSFSGFYYDIKDDVGTENITITLNSYSDRTINKNDLDYSTTPQEVSFVYSGFGKFQVIGFMADKYFAGYTANTKPPNPKPSVTFDGKSVIASGQLHKVLMDDDTKKTISLGSTMTLQEGYVLKAVDIDMSARTMLLSLLKDGNEVDSTPLSAGETYVYTKKVGSVSDLPLIMVRFDSVFSGREVQAAFLKGLFQISETATNVESGDKFGRMEVGGVSGTRIDMSNSEDISLSTGSTVDLMGDVKIKVADNSSVVRFALTVEKSGPYEVRSSIFKQDDPNNITVWTPYNFGMNIGQTSVGFYYDLDDGVGNESMRIAETVSGRKINDGKLVYMTTPEKVSFTYPAFGKYNVIGFMAEKYFAGYTIESFPSTVNPTTSVGEKSVLDSGQLHKVLIDDDTKKTISVGSTMTLQEGYVLKAVDIDMSARTMLISLLKDGNEVDTSPLYAGQTYIYTKKVGDVSDLPLIAVRFDSVFSGKEVQAAFLKGLFQISETATTVRSGDKFGKMEVTGISRNSIEMANDGNLGLDRNKNDDLMGNIKLRVADSDSLRFYFAVDVTQEMIANQLVIDAPAKVMAGDNITITVKAGGNPVDNASVSLDSDLGNTDKNGLLNYTLPKTLKGMYNITATKLGYEKQVKPIEIEKYIDLRLSLDIPAKAPQFDPLTIKVTYNNSAMSGASVKFDNDAIGTTDSNGILTYTPQVSGTHTITASKSGYVTVTRDIELIVPYSEFKALDINITPAVATPGLTLLIKANITNSGTKGDTLPVDLIINGTAVKNTTLSLDRGATKEINFTGNLKGWMPEEVKPGNYTVEILGQTQLLEVKEEPLSLLLIGGIVVIITGIAGGVIYVLTSKNMLSIEALKSKFSDLLSGLGKIRK
ncbi:S-layer protein [uncultured archaeon]|nr:S-layer protein [uncultured archaeon]